MTRGCMAAVRPTYFRLGKSIHCKKLRRHRLCKHQESRRERLFFWRNSAIGPSTEELHSNLPEETLALARFRDEKNPRLEKTERIAGTSASNGPPRSAKDNSTA